MNDWTSIRRLAWAELSYRRKRILGSYIFILAFFVLRWNMQVGGFARDWAEIPAHLSVMIHLTLIVNLILALSIFSNWKTEKRDRLLVALPLDRRTIYHARLLAVGLLQLIPFAGLTLACLIIGGVEAWAWDGTIVVPAFPLYDLQVNGWTAIHLLGLGFYSCLLGMLVYSRRKPVWLNIVVWFALLILSNLLAYPAGSSHNVFLPGMDALASPRGSLVMLVLSAFLILVNRELFIRRRGPSRN